MEPQPNTPQGSEPGPLPGFVDRAEPDRFCDLVLTGGVTSSIAYPGAVHALGSVFRFNGIGGSSSGGGTAALAAAAEYRRRHGSAEGFRQMLAGSAEVADGFEGRTGLAWLFQPDAGLQRLFDAIVPGVVAPTGKFWALVRGLLLAYGPFALVPAAGLGSVAYLALASHFPASWLGALAGFGLLALALAAGAVVAGLVLWRDLRRLAAADHGLCSGLARQADAPREPITPWLHGLIQQVAGRAPGEAPLSFADLHGAPGGPAQALNDGSSAGARSIDLRMFSADVTRGLPLQLPLPDATPGSDPSVPDDAALYFLPQELATLFPADVMAHLLAVSPPAPGQGLRVAGGPGAPALSGFRRLPGAQLPVIVAARMTVSFPLLFRAVPLWALSRPAARAGQPPPPPELRRCLFSDGGLISAFPMHLFDSLLPAWPTFGIALHPLGADDLQALSEDEVGRVRVAAGADDLGPERWDTPSQPPRGLADLVGFAGALLSTLTGWNDNAVRRMAGVRDRVAHVSLRPDVGGLNIRMSPQRIRQLAQLGGEAGYQLLRRYVLELGPGGHARGWSEHRWTRFALLAQSLAKAGESLGWSALRAPHAEPLPQQIERARHDAPLARSTAQAEHRRRRRATLLAHEAATLQGLLQALQTAEPALRRAAGAVPDAPGPPPELRQRPPL
ncbi:MAG: patatin-like phospholipase family protein [Ideonella sp. WA131b]|nr:patatin-like phospholipase family protein [Ideonella sp. WA131b]